MGVFIISPTDKGGHLHTPSQRLLELCDPLHPIVFNDLFCLRDPRVHTISVGAARPSDLDLHLEAVAPAAGAASWFPVDQRLAGADEALGRPMATWSVGLPPWHATPGNQPAGVVAVQPAGGLGSRELCQARYGLLGSGGHWFAGANADGFDAEVSAEELQSVLQESPWRERIPEILRSLSSGSRANPRCVVVWRSF